MLRLAAVAAAATLVTGCASVTGSPNQNVTLRTQTLEGSEIAGARCELVNNKGLWFVQTPGSVRVHRSNDDLQVVCHRPGLAPGRAAVVSETKGTMFGNIILGGAIGALIDHSNGSAYEYPPLIEVVMGAPLFGEPAAPVGLPIAVATAAMPGTTRPNELKARELALAGCTANPRPYSVAGGPGQALELFHIACADGRQMRVRCDAGACRELGR